MKKPEEDLEDARELEMLKDNSRFNTSGLDDDLYMDIQDAIDRDTSLTLMADNIHITVENEIVTLDGEVFEEQERIAAGKIAMACAGNDNVNNCLNVMQN
jgi:osmotically-inducible protein OsmY